MNQFSTLEFWRNLNPRFIVLNLSQMKAKWCVIQAVRCVHELHKYPFCSRRQKWVIACDSKFIEVRAVVWPQHQDESSLVPISKIDSRAIEWISMKRHESSDAFALGQNHLHFALISKAGINNICIILEISHWHVPSSTNSIDVNKN